MQFSSGSRGRAAATRSPRRPPGTPPRPPGGGPPASDEEAPSPSARGGSSSGAAAGRGDAQSETQPRKRARFAWMDSGDEDGGGGASSSESSGSRGRRSRGGGGRGSPERAAPAGRLEPPVPAARVATLPEMLRLVAETPRGKMLRLSLAELADLLEAAARVHYYDASVFGDLTSAVKVHLRGRGACRPQHVGAVVAALAELNAYDRELFDLAAGALERVGADLERSVRQTILRAFKKAQHQGDSAILAFLAQQEGLARYAAACQDVSASWQKAGTISGAAMPLGIGR
ncbi:unnamed protein product [Prorocentrum cordatum]|uniref:Uncharacterized protein n=1 Tax=Prorocentrum cordatum TaxID=2364126 RepID=A0ABN9RW28_9DINO|nr:unnamed protein product [Polarella glacialis]